MAAQKICTSLAAEVIPQKRCHGARVGVQRQRSGLGKQVEQARPAWADFFSGLAKGVPAPLRLPTDRAPPSRLNRRGATLPAALGIGRLGGAGLFLHGDHVDGITVGPVVDLGATTPVAVHRSKPRPRRHGPVVSEPSCCRSSRTRLHLGGPRAPARLRSAAMRTGCSVVSRCARRPWHPWALPGMRAVDIHGPRQPAVVAAASIGDDDHAGDAPPAAVVQADQAPPAGVEQGRWQRPVGDGVGAVLPWLGPRLGLATGQSRWSRPMTMGALSSPFLTISLKLPGPPLVARSPRPSQQIRDGRPWKAMFLRHVQPAVGSACSRGTVP